MKKRKTAVVHILWNGYLYCAKRSYCTIFVFKLPSKLKDKRKNKVTLSIDCRNEKEK